MGPPIRGRYTLKDITLQRRIEVHCWNVLGTVARSSKRPEIIPVLLRARERGHTNARDVAEHLLSEPRSRLVVADCLLRNAESYGLMARNESSYSLSEAGVAALASEQVLVPERGTWTIWAGSDPLLTYPILRLDSWSEPTAHSQLKAKQNNDRTFVDLPAWLRKSEGRVGAPPGGGGALLQIGALDQKGERVKTDSTLTVVWNVGERKMRLEGTLEGARLDTVLDAPDLAPEAVWQQLLESERLWPRSDSTRSAWWGSERITRWDSERNALLVSFNDTNERERESLLRDLAIRSPTVAGRGTFDPVTIHDVSVYPRNADDAARWAAWRLNTRSRDYATSERFDAWTKEAMDPFNSFSLPVRSRADLARDAWPRHTWAPERPSPAAWYLMAAEDWNL